MAAEPGLSALKIGPIFATTPGLGLGGRSDELLELLLSSETGKLEGVALPELACWPLGLLAIMEDTGRFGLGAGDFLLASPLLPALALMMPAKEAGLDLVGVAVPDLLGVLEPEAGRPELDSLAPGAAAGAFSLLSLVPG